MFLDILVLELGLSAKYFLHHLPVKITSAHKQNAIRNKASKLLNFHYLVTRKITKHVSVESLEFPQIKHIDSSKSKLFAKKHTHKKKIDSQILLNERQFQNGPRIAVHSYAGLMYILYGRQ